MLRRSIEKRLAVFPDMCVVTVARYMYGLTQVMYLPRTLNYGETGELG